MQRIIFPIVLFLFGWAYTMIYGRVGLSALDSSIVFDGAWRWLNDQKFMVDLYTPNGFVPIVLQAICFKLFGVNWFSYVLHAAIFNGLFTLLVYHMLNHFGGTKWLNAFYSLCSAVVFYPPFGMPYMDQHAIFFSLLAVTSLLSATRTTGYKQTLVWLTIPSILMLAVLSKQTPSLYMLPVSVILFPVLVPKSQWQAAILKLAIGLIISALIPFTLFDWAQIDHKEAWNYFWQQPSQIGASRLQEALDLDKSIFEQFWLHPYQLLSRFNFWDELILYILPALLILYWLIRFLLKKNWEPILNWRAFQSWWLSFWLVGVMGAYLILTNNQRVNGLAYTFLCVGLAHGAILHVIEPIKVQYLNQLKSLKWVVQAISILLVIHFLSGAIDFHNEVVTNRTVHDFEPKKGPEINFSNDELGYLQWSEAWHGNSRNPSELITFLRQKNQPFFLFGDFTFLYGMVAQPSVAPNLWWHEGLTYPIALDPNRATFELRLAKAVQQLHPAYVIFENSAHETYLNTELSDFKELDQWIQNHKMNAFKIGAYELWELDYSKSQ